MEFLYVFRNIWDSLKPFMLTAFGQEHTIYTSYRTGLQLCAANQLKQKPGEKEGSRNVEQGRRDLNIKTCIHIVYNYNCMCNAESVR